MRSYILPLVLIIISSCGFIKKADNRSESDTREAADQTTRNDKTVKPATSNPTDPKVTVDSDVLNAKDIDPACKEAGASWDRRMDEILCSDTRPSADHFCYQDLVGNCQGCQNAPRTYSWKTLAEMCRSYLNHRTM